MIQGREYVVRIELSHGDNENPLSVAILLVVHAVFRTIWKSAIEVKYDNINSRVSYFGGAEMCPLSDESNFLGDDDEGLSPCHPMDLLLEDRMNPEYAVFGTKPFAVQGGQMPGYRFQKLPDCSVTGLQR